jgi:hypothetical protein
VGGAAHVVIALKRVALVLDESVRLRAMHVRCACAPFPSLYIWYDMVRWRAMLGALARLVLLFDGTMLAHMFRSVAAILS